MPKTRLNRDKRDVLHALAAHAVQDTPLDPAIEKRVKAARVMFDRIHERRQAEAGVLVARKYPAGDMKTLAKYELTKHVQSVLFVDLDTKDHFNVELFNDHKWSRENRAVDPHSYEENSRRKAARAEVVKGISLEVPSGSPSQPSYMRSPSALEASGKLIGMRRVLKEALDELNVAEHADKERRDSIQRDFVALIEGSRTFEVVIEAWPEAKKVTDQIVGAGRAVSLVSSEAIERIRANMQARNVKE